MADNPDREIIKSRLDANLAMLGISITPTGGVRNRVKTYRRKQRRGTRRVLK